jgi:hypothetical protein
MVLSLMLHYCARRWSAQLTDILMDLRTFNSTLATCNLPFCFEVVKLLLAGSSACEEVDGTYIMTLRSVTQ